MAAHPSSITELTPAADAAAFFRLVKHPLKFRFFLFTKLPSAFFAGVRVKSVNETRSEVTVPHKWFSQNPFRSTYFACLSMAAEMSTGVLAMAHLHKITPPVSMLVLKAEGDFIKKATGLTTFICNEGKEIQSAIAQAIITKTPQSIRVSSRGISNTGETIAQFCITWSFKAKEL